MDSTKKSLLKTLSWETFHLIGVAGVLAVSVYIAWEALGYFLHERVWAKFGKKVK